MFTPWFVPLQGSDSFLGNQLFLIMIIVGVFYFIVLRPMRTKQQETENMLKELR